MDRTISEILRTLEQHAPTIRRHGVRSLGLFGSGARGTAGVESGRRQSTAVFLAEQKIEQIKAWSLSTAANQGFTTVVPGGGCFTSAAPPGVCNNDAFGAIPGYPEYNRTVTITCMTGGPPPLASACPGGTVRMVRVQVQYRRVTDRGVLTGGQQVDVATIIAQH